MASPVVFFEVLGKDGQALRDFYSALFGWQITTPPGPMDYGMVAKEGESGIEGGIGTAPDSGNGCTTFYVRADDPQAVLDRAAELGGSTVLAPTELPAGGVKALVADPEGHTIGLWKAAEDMAAPRVEREVFREMLALGGIEDLGRDFERGDFLERGVALAPGDARVFDGGGV